jgi:hypothetical protein
MQKMFHSLKIDSGAALIHQSHKNKLDQRSLSMFMQMSNNRDILNLMANEPIRPIARVENTYLTGFAKFKKTIRTTDPQLSKFKKHLVQTGGSRVVPAGDGERSDDEDASSGDL